MSEKTTERRKLWKNRLEEWRSSGKSVAAWCRENGFCYQTVLGWRKRFGEKSEENDRTFLELEESESGGGVELEVKGVTIRVLPRFSEVTLLRCLRLLGEL